jgi:hypothetical protein
MADYIDADPWAILDLPLIFTSETFVSKDIEIEFEAEDEAGLTLEGFNVMMQVRKNPRSEVIFEAKDTNGRVEIVDLEGRIIRFIFTVDDMRGIPAGDYRHDLILYDGDDIRIMAKGVCNFRDGYSRPVDL